MPATPAAGREAGENLLHSPQTPTQLTTDRTLLPSDLRHSVSIVTPMVVSVTAAPAPALSPPRTSSEDTSCFCVSDQDSLGRGLLP